MSTEFRQIIAKGDNEIDLAKAALLIAKSEYNQLDISYYLSKLDEMASVVYKRLDRNASVAHVIGEMNHFLFDEQGFAGNNIDFHDPRNSFLNDVLERRKGVPISLSLIYMEIGQRLGLPFDGVMFPGHFLVKLSVFGGEIVLDPYIGGQSLSLDELRFRLHGFCDLDDEGHPSLQEFLVPACKKDMLIRILYNLKSVYLMTEQYLKTLNVIDHILAINPLAELEIRDRAFIFEKLDCFNAACEDYQQYLGLAPDGPDCEEIRARFIAMQHARAGLH